MLAPETEVNKGTKRALESHRKTRVPGLERVREERRRHHSVSKAS